MGPKGMPDALVKKLHGELMKVLHTPDMEKTLINMGSTSVGSTPQEFRKYLAADLEKWSKVVKASGAKAY